MNTENPYEKAERSWCVKVEVMLKGPDTAEGSPASTRGFLHFSVNENSLAEAFNTAQDYLDKQSLFWYDIYEIYEEEEGEEEENPT
jgi:hypothetical protein